jgi:hypothetical protein
MTKQAAAAVREHATYQQRFPNPVEEAVETQWSAGESLLKELAVTTELHSFRPEVRRVSTPPVSQRPHRRAVTVSSTCQE